MDHGDLQVELERASMLEATLSAHVANAIDDSRLRNKLCSATCGLSLEHANSLRVLIAVGNHTSANALLRSQFEAVTRAVWLQYAASESDLEKLGADLSLESQESAKKLPSVTEMLKTILTSKAPLEAIHQLSQFKDIAWHPLNSFVHAGIHAVNRFENGFPVRQLIQVIRCSNGLSLMAVMILAMLSGDSNLTKGMRKIQSDFRDCLPPVN